MTAFTTGGVRAVVAPDSAIAPPGWVGLLAVQDTLLVAAPDAVVAAQVQQALGSWRLEQVLDLSVLAALPQVVDVLGPAWLSYLTPGQPAPPVGAHLVEVLPSQHSHLAPLLAAATAGEIQESGLEKLTSPVCVARQEGVVVAAAGHTMWPDGVVHMGVLSAPAVRGRGVAASVASVALGQALKQELVVQWRARPPASRRLAARLGLHEVGCQISFPWETVSP